jgi:Tfp pilus assembly protein PilN
MKLRRPKELVVAEISNYLLKMVYARGQQIQWAHHWPLGNASDREISNHIRALFEEKKIALSRGLLILSRNALTVGMLHIPSSDQQEIASMVEVNAIRQVPYPRSEIVLGWRVVSVDGSGFSDVLLAICQRVLVKRHITILETAGLSVEDVQIGTEGTVSWLLSKDKSVSTSQKVEFVLDIDERYSDLIAISEGNLMMSRLIAHGVEFLKGAGSDNTRYFINEFKQTLGMLPESLLEKKSSNLFLVGARQRFPELEDSLEKEFKFNIKRIEPPVEDLVPMDISFCGLLGIALNSLPKRIIFDIPEIKIKKEWQRKLKQLILLGGLITYILVVILVTTGHRIYRQQELLTQLETQYSAIYEEAGDLSNLVEKIKMIQDIKSPRGSLLHYLYTISNVLPDGCRIVNFDYQRDRQIVVRGQTEAAISSIFDFVSSLEKSKVFSSVQTRYTRKVSGEEFQGSEFEIVCLLR